MSKADYVLRSISKIAHKRWEHYAIGRIFHRLDDLDIEFVCQQCIRKSDGKRYLADLFFPQLGIYLEIDEGHHADNGAVIRDAVRRFDIADAAGLVEHRIKAYGVRLEEFDAAVEDFILLLRAEKAKAVAAGRFQPWDYDSRFTAKPHLEAGKLEIGPHAAFRTHKDALNCFGYNKGHLRKAVWNVPPHVANAVGLAGKCVVWFPKLYENEDWNNSLSDDGLSILEINKNAGLSYQDPWDTRIVMPRSRDELNRTLYRFVGVFEVAPGFRSSNEHRFRRIATKVRTYKA